MSDGHKPTSGMKSAAARALAWHKDGKRGGTIVGLTRANQIVNGTALSDSTVKRMYSFFSRHEVDKKATGFSAGEEGYPSAGRVAWDLWGGDSGYSWSRKVVNQLKNKDMKKMMKLSVGDTVSWNSSGGKATGKITRIVVAGKINVPGSDFVITGTKENPAALIRLYRDGKPTDTYVGHKLDTLRSAKITKNGEMPEDMGPSDELENLNERQVHQYEYYESLANDFGLFKQDTSADGAHYSAENPFKSEGLMCGNCVFFEEGACEIVEGNINPEGVCKLWIIPEERLVKNMDTNNVEKRNYNTKQRNQMAQRGQALPDGSFPIANEQDLRNAIQSYGRASNAAQAKAHIIRRAKSLGLTELLPEDWKKFNKSIWSGTALDSTGLR